MPSRNTQLSELLSLSNQSVAQLTEALTAFSLELMASDDPAVRIASRRMVSRIAAIRAACDQRLNTQAACLAIDAPGQDDSALG